MIYLNLGCGNKKFDGFINIDSRKECNPDLIYDIKNDIKVKCNSNNMVLKLGKIWILR